MQGTDTIKDSVVKRFAEDIFSDRLKAGDKLPTERDIAEEMQVSRSIVHLAMEQLASMKLIQMQPRVGNFVCDYRRYGNFETLMMLAEYGDSFMDQDMTYALVELRNAIEGAAMELLSRSGTAEDFACLRSINAEFGRKIDENADISELVACNRRFHLEIVNRCGNPFYVMTLNSFSGIRAPWIRCLEHWTPRGMYEQNEKTADLLESGRGKEAAEYIVSIFEKYKAAN